MFRKILEKLRKCHTCNGNGFTADITYGHDKMMVEGELLEIALVRNKKTCKACQGTGKCW